MKNYADKIYTIKKWFIIKYESIKQLIAWIPILWKDRDWESRDLYIIMKFKISRMRKLLERCSIHHSHADDIRHMKIAEELLDRLIKDDYFLIDDANKDKCTCPDPDYVFEQDPKHNNFRTFVSLKCNYCSGMFKYWIEKQDSKEKTDKRYLFKILEKYSGRWWC